MTGFGRIASQKWMEPDQVKNLPSPVTVYLSRL